MFISVSSLCSGTIPSIILGRVIHFVSGLLQEDESSTSTDFAQVHTGAQENSRAGRTHANPPSSESSFLSVSLLSAVLNGITFLFI